MIHTEMFPEIFKDGDTLIGTAKEKSKPIFRNVVAVCNASYAKAQK